MRRFPVVRRGFILAVMALLPLTSGADCSSNAVGQAAATTAANAAVTQFVTLVFQQVSEANQASP